ncbi:MAG: MmgE/PrpD family protein [Candidatus Rokubacteria bacterium]|nr:MmgE/PrpD family protein [Candidatus Rokubacteria bacterium]
MTSTDYLDRLARLVAGTRCADLRESTVAAAKAVTLDTLGAILAGSRLPQNAKLAALAAARSGTKSAALIGHAERAEPMFAALANTTAGVSLEMDEGNRWGGGHPAIHVLPAALAVAEELAAAGPQFLEALVAGYEVVTRIGGATRLRPNVHAHGTWGTLGAAAAVARLERLDAAAVRAAVNLAGSMSPANTWTPCFEGATIRDVYAGRAGLQGILAVHLLGCGFTAVRDAPGDVYGTILADEFDPSAAVEGLPLDGLPDTFRIERNYFKFHACCLYNHPALDAVGALVREHRLTPDAVARVAVTSIPFVERMADPEPPAMLAAKFSVPYAVAAAIVLGRTDVTAFVDDARTDARVRDLARRVDVRGDASMALRASDRPTARVAVTLRDGRTLERETRVIHGDAANPPAREELIEKFACLATDVIGKERVADVVALVDRLDRVADVRELTALVAG